MKLYWFNKKCCVPECYNSSTEGEGCYKEFFDLPAEPQSRARWLNAILSKDGENLKICEDHFREDDIFRDKNHRKKLRLNSVPSQKLPKSICTLCLGYTRPLKYSEKTELKMCQCNKTVPAEPVAAVAAPVSETSPEKRMRITWTAEEKRTLFRSIKKYGDVKIVNSHIRINWNSVFSNCRDNGCFGNERELKSAWQYLRTRAAKVYKNEVYGTKLERKVSRFLYGKGPKLQKIRTTALNNNADGSASANMDVGTSDDEFNEDHPLPATITEDPHEEYMTDNNNESLDKYEEQEGTVNRSSNPDAGLGEMQDEEEDEKVCKTTTANEDPDTGNETCSESEDEYYSIDDVRNKLGIKIAPRESEVISLISSDESDKE